MKHAVFICHAHKDQSIADAICGKLESADLKCWITTRDISAREDWTEATRKAIESSRVIVLVLSENANASPHIEKEIAHAFYMRRIILPFRLAETLPRREILFYLGNVPWLSALNPPTEEQLEALTARLQGLLPGSPGAGNASPPPDERKKTASLGTSTSWFGALESSHSRTLGILKGVAITTFLCAVLLFLWFALRQTNEWASLAEIHRRSMDRGFSLSPTPSPQSGEDALEAKRTPTFTRFGSWQAANGSPTPLVQGPQEPALDTPAERPANATSSPPHGVTPEERTGGLAAEPRPHQLPPVTHRVSHDRHQQYPGTQVKEARKIADLENQRDSLRSQLQDTEGNVLAMQKKVDLVTGQRDELQARLNESEEKTRIAQKNADLVARELDELRAQLKETEDRALAAQTNEELLRTQRDALQSEMGELRERAQVAETHANLAASQRDAMEVELKRKEAEEAQEKTAQVNQPGAELGELADSSPDTQFQEVRQEAQPPHEDAEFAQTQPPNPGQNVKPAPITQTLDSGVQPIGPSEK